MTAAVLAAAVWHVATHEVLAFTAAFLFLSLIDDCLVDLIYLVLASLGRTRRTELPARAADPGWMAIIVPAWDEAAVIGTMLTTLVRTLDYPRYRVFVGVYPNDPATRAAVAAVNDPRVELIGCTRPGPTTKADCLNHLWRAAVAHEATAGIRFKAVVLHDAEDVVDGAELRVFDACLAGLAMVQLPVVPLADPTSRWVSGHYMDEFAEAHGKDVLVRGMIGAGVPSAGVACAIDRDVLAQLGNGSVPFDPTSMTEDYELGMRLAGLGRRAALVRCRGPSGTVATREHFPATIDAAVRQKTRWLLGIALDGWDRIGWTSGFADTYMLLRDRKTVVAPLLVAAAYCAAAMCGVDAVVAWAVPAARAFPPLVPRGPLLAGLLIVNAAGLGWRVGARAGFTTAAYGWREGLRAVPRIVVSNWINAVAAAHAIRRYHRIRAGRERPLWDKTAHRMPTSRLPAQR